jgi:hypothetical protein
MLLAACQTSRVPLTAAPPQAQGPQADLVSLLYEAGLDLPAAAFRGTALYTESSGSRHHFQFEAFIQKPDLFAFLVLGPGGGPVFRLNLAGDSVTILDYGQKVYAAGQAENLDPKFLPLALKPRELAALLSGFLPARPRQVQLIGHWTDPPRSEFLAWFGEPGLTAEESPPDRLVLDGAPGEPGRPILRQLASRTLSGEPLTVSYDRLTETVRRDNGGTILFPRRLRAEIGRSRQKRSLAVSYEEAVLGLVLPAGNFELVQPAGFDREDL